MKVYIVQDEDSVIVETYASEYQAELLCDRIEGYC